MAAKTAPLTPNTDEADVAAAEMKALLAQVAARATAGYGGSNPGRVAQLAAALATADMAVEHLAVEVPYTPPTP